MYHHHYCNQINSSLQSANYLWRMAKIYYNDQLWTTLSEFSKLDQVVTLLIYTQEVNYLNLGWNTDCLMVLSHNRFFHILFSSLFSIMYQLMLVAWVCQSVIKRQTNKHLVEWHELGRTNVWPASCVVVALFNSFSESTCFNSWSGYPLSWLKINMIFSVPLVKQFLKMLFVVVCEELKQLPGP
jgi:hypothetical protein